MKKRTLYQTVLLCSAVLLILMAASLRKADPSSFPKPTVSTVMNGTWSVQVEEYMAESMGFHDVLFRLKSGMDMLLGEKLIQDVYITDGMMLEKIATVEKSNIQTMAEGINQFYETYQLPTYLILAPSATSIYENQLPNNVVTADQELLLRNLYAGVNSYVRCIDTHHILSSVSDAYIYYRTDSHWTSYGAYCVYQTAIQKMGFSAIPYSRYVISHVSTDFRGDLYERTLVEGIQPDVLDYYHCESGALITEVNAYYQNGKTEEREPHVYDMALLNSEEDQYRFYLGTPCDKLVIRTDLENGKRLLLYKDDFADCMIPFLAQHYSEICVIDLESTTDDLAKLVDPKEYTQVLFLASLKNWCEYWT